VGDKRRRYEMTTRPFASEERLTGKVLESAPADPAEAREHFGRKLRYETDPADVRADVDRGISGFVLVDTRSREAYHEGHVPGAVSLPYADMDEGTVASLVGEKVAITYCWGPACNAATKGALKLASLGVPVKEMIGGYEYWVKEGYPVERG
jgi:rhodanese-related sulfurtransferase